MAEFKRSMLADGGLSSRRMLKIYRGIVEPILLYEAEFWGEEMVRKDSLRKKWLAAQRRVLLMVTLLIGLSLMRPSG